MYEIGYGAEAIFLLLLAVFWISNVVFTRAMSRWASYYTIYALRKERVCTLPRIRCNLRIKALRKVTYTQFVFIISQWSIKFCAFRSLPLDHSELSTNLIFDQILAQFKSNSYFGCLPPRGGPGADFESRHIIWYTESHASNISYSNVAISNNQFVSN